MGFWHTGYMEFHEEVGLEGYEFQPSTPEYPCAACGEIFATADELQTHRLEQHPLHRPGLIVRGAVAGSGRMIITSKQEAADIVLERCERVLLNGQEIPVERLGEELAARAWETCHLIVFGDTVVQVMNDGTDEVGGDVFDETIMQRILTKVAHEKGLSNEIDIQPGAKERLLEACERAKIALSGRSSASVYVGNFFRNTDSDDVDYTLSKEELEEAVGTLLDKGFARIDKVLADAGYGHNQVELCLATGGMSNMPTVKERLHLSFGPQRVSVPDETATLIAEGAARIAADNASLHLAKNVELELARSSYLPLLKAGTRMPRGGTMTRPEKFHLYCTDPRDGKAKFQICAPRRAGRKVRPNEPRTCLETMTVKVDAKARLFHERLELTVKVDENLILHAHAHALNRRDDDQCEIHNLEFGLRLRGTDGGANEDDEGEPAEEEESGRSTAIGALMVRANVTNVQDRAKIPGEYLYQLDPDYFDRRHRPPEEQNFEKLYYQPCSVCGCASNDPACKCASALYDDTRRNLAPTPKTAHGQTKGFGASPRR